MERTDRKVNKFFALIFAVVLLFALAVTLKLSTETYAAGTSDAELKRLQDSLASATQNRKDAQKAYNSAKEEKATLVEQKSVLDKELIAIQNENDIIKELADEYENQIAVLGGDISLTEKELDDMLDSLRSRLRSQYEDGYASYINVIFKSRTVTEFLTQLQWITYVTNYDKNLIEECNTYHQRLESDRQEIIQLQDEAKKQLKALEESAVLLEKKRTEIEEHMKSVEKDMDSAYELYTKYFQNEKQFTKQVEELIAERQNQNQTEYVGGDFMWPLPKSDKYVTSPFGYRVHPITGVYEFHGGIDISSHLGTDIYSVNDGVVAEASWSNGNGYYVLIDHGGGYMSYYSHLSKILVTKNQVMKKGDLVGYVGMTGLATGYHLHFSVYQNGKVVDPLKFYDTSWMIMYY